MNLEHAIDISEEGGVRFLHFGSDWVQGAMRISRPYALELDYTREMMASLLLRPASPWPRNALLIGLGAGSLARFFHRHLPETRVTVVEINGRVVSAARQFFKLPETSERFRVIVDDGASWVAKGGEPFDAILVDGFDPDARAGALETPKFYSACQERLTDDGLLVINLLGRNRGFAAATERLRSVFGPRAIVFPSNEDGNAIAFAATGAPVDVTVEEMQEDAQRIKKEMGLNLVPTVTRLHEARRLPGRRLVL